MVENRASTSLRATLRRDTAAAHALVDQAVEALDLTDPADYAAFLRLQLSARLPIERWAARFCPEDLRPPAVTHLIIDDLAMLGRPYSLAGRVFTLPAGADPRGLAWALSGSHLGNRAILSRMQKAGANMPASFLSDPAMGEFWLRLRPRIEAPASAAECAAARVAALAVFAAFQGGLASVTGRLAA